MIARTLRESEQVRVRQPLRRLTVAGADVERLRPFAELIADEVNVKQVKLTTEIEPFASFRLQVNARQVGPRLGATLKKILAAAKRGAWESLPEGGVRVAGETLTQDDFTLLLEPREGITCHPLSTNDAIVVLDLHLDEALVFITGFVCYLIVAARGLRRALREAERDR